MVMQDRACPIMVLIHPTKRGSGIIVLQYTESVNVRNLLRCNFHSKGRMIYAIFSSVGFLLLTLTFYIIIYLPVSGKKFPWHKLPYSSSCFSFSTFYSDTKICCFHVLIEFVWNLEDICKMLDRLQERVLYVNKKEECLYKLMSGSECFFISAETQQSTINTKTL